MCTRSKQFCIVYCSIVINKGKFAPAVIAGVIFTQ